MMIDPDVKETTVGFLWFLNKNVCKLLSVIGDVLNL